MPNYQISATQLTENQYIVVKGTLTFARIAKVVEGEELERSDARRAQNGMNPIGRPHTTISLAGADVVFNDSTQPTLEERFVQERRYVSKKHPEHGQCYSIDNKSDRLPAVFQKNEEGKLVPVVLEGELASGTPVMLVLRTYKPKKHNNRGLSLDQVIIDQPGPVPYYRTATETELESRGIVYAAPIQSQVTSSPAQAPAPQQEQPAPAQETESLPMPQPAPQADPYRSEPQQAPQPAPQAAPAPAQGASEGEDLEAQIARLQALKAEQDAKASGESAFAPQDQDPWKGGQTGITYNG